ncbi:hypothetical protein LLS1_22810 [Leifsonia sp. LS1]|uniref:LamG-like jellyroll fold domain-containing protein n=1 Tax=Leifsonia sp. LS1 TaxID=2828483 RepID=UPI001CFF39EE|nr:LamG-like jellyroll fold domain-containing protein [Leifsonia sp. LS1]GIT80612.1 hypothetical protein LLS1_22810 [Leifsonia sp. LS1]
MIRSRIVAALTTAGALAVLITAPTAAAALEPSVDPGAQLVRPQPIDTVLDNPGMGWEYIDNALPGLHDEGTYGTFPEFTNVSVLSDWGTLEPSPGTYDWTLLDNAISYWSSQGKRIHFRIGTDGMEVGPGTTYSGGAPLWLASAPYGVAYQTKCDNQTLTAPSCLNTNGSQAAKFRVWNIADAQYLARLQSFMAAFGARYDHDSRIDTIDLRGYGEWGEWHSGYDITSMTTRISALKSVIDAWSNAFPDKVLNLSDSYEWRTAQQPAGVTSPASYADFMKNSAFDYALTKPNISFRRDGVSGCLQDDDRRGLEAAWQNPNRLPVTLEYCGGYPVDSWSSVRNRLDDILSLHANYATVMGWDGGEGALGFYANEAAAIKEGNLRMGYRFVVNESALPRTIVPGTAFDIRQVWSNVAVGRAWKKYQLTYSLVNSSGTTVWSSVAAGFDPRDIVEGRPLTSNVTMTIPNTVASGSYQLRFGLRDTDLGVPIKLAIAGVDAATTYPVGTVSVAASASTAPVAATFESGTFAGSGFTAGLGGTTGTITSDPAKVVTGTRSVTASAPATTPYTEYAYSDQAAIPLAPLTSYTVRFATKTTTASGSGGGNYVLARTATGGVPKDVGFTVWNDPGDATVKNRSVTFTTGAYSDYYLIFGLKNGGAVSLDDITVTQNAFESFRTSSFADSLYTAGTGGTTGSLTNASGTAISGYSARGSAPTSTPFTEFLTSNPSRLALKPLTSYTVSFRSRMTTASGSGGGDYVLARSATAGVAKDVGFTVWNDPGDGAVKSRSVTFTTGAYPDYQLIFGLKNGGAVAIDDISVVGTVDAGDGLVGGLPLDEGSGTTTAVLGAGGTAALQNGASWTAGVHAGAVAFNGSDAVVPLPSTPALDAVQTGSYSLSARYKPSTLPTGTGAANTANQAVLTKQGFHSGIFYDADGHFHMAQVFADNSVVDVRSVSSFQPNSWHTITATVNQTTGTVFLYVDGTWQNEWYFTPGKSTYPYGSTPWTVGNAAPGASSYRWPANGAIDDVFIWNRVLSPADATNLAAG